MSFVFRGVLRDPKREHDEHEENTKDTTKVRRTQREYFVLFVFRGVLRDPKRVHDDTIKLNIGKMKLEHDRRRNYKNYS